MEHNGVSVGFLLADVSRLMRQRFQRRNEDSQLTQAQARTLVYLARNEGMRQVELAELLDIQPITLARLIDQLAEAGLVERRSDQADRRAYRLFLTAAAGPHLLAIDRVAHAVRAEAMQGLDPQETEILLAALRKMRDNLAGR